MQEKAAYIRSKVDRPFSEPCTSEGYVHRAALFIKWIMEFRFSKSRLETWLVTDCSCGEVASSTLFDDFLPVVIQVIRSMVFDSIEKTMRFAWFKHGAVCSISTEYPVKNLL
jgi:hypothetical protein